MKSLNIITKMLNKTVRQGSTIAEDFLNPRVGLKMKLQTKLAKQSVAKIGELASMTIKMKDSLFLRVMEHLFPIVLHGTLVMGRQAHKKIV